MRFFIVNNLRKFILTFFVGLIFATALFTKSMIQPPTASAASCKYEGQCVNNKKCVCPVGTNYYVCRYSPSVLTLSDIDCGSAIIGGVQPPTAISALNQESGSDIGIIFFVSRLITFANVVAGILVMINFVYSGFIYIANSGNTAVNTQVTERITWSVVGILVIIGSYALAGIIGLIFYGDPTYIISPTLQTAI